MPIRNSVKAVIVHEGRLLAIRHADGEGDYFTLPGGGQEFGETFHETLRRECLEEACAEVEIGPIVFIREYIGAHHEFAQWDSDAHQVEYMFSCRLLNPGGLGTGPVPDTGQKGLAWLPLDELGGLRLYPKAIRRPLKEGRSDSVYLGDVN